MEAITRTQATNQCPHRCKQVPLCLLGIPAFPTYDETKYLKNLILQLDTNNKQTTKKYNTPQKTTTKKQTAKAWLFQLHISIFEMSLFKTIHK